MSNANRAAALRSGSRVEAFRPRVSAMLTIAVRATAGNSAATGRAMPREKWTNRMVNSWPITATQRINDTVCRRTRPGAPSTKPEISERRRATHILADAGADVSWVSSIVLVKFRPGATNYFCVYRRCFLDGRGFLSRQADIWPQKVTFQPGTGRALPAAGPRWPVRLMTRTRCRRLAREQPLASPQTARSPRPKRGDRRAGSRAELHSTTICAARCRRRSPAATQQGRRPASRGM